jgi:sortase A
MFRFFRSYGVILMGLLLAGYGLASTASALAQPAAGETDLALQQAAIAQAVEAAERPEQTAPLELKAAPPPPAAPEHKSSQPKTRTASAAPERLPAYLLIEKQFNEFSPPTPTALPAPETPLRLVIPAIQLDAPVIPAETYYVEVDGKEYQQWPTPNEFAAGWHSESAPLGEPGNTVLNGHHNIYGEVFRDLVNLTTGDTIVVYGEGHVYTYMVTNRMILPERFQQIDVRMNNAQWIQSSQDERLTLITCWPYESNTHRLILVAKPLSIEKLARKLQ